MGYLPIEFWDLYDEKGSATQIQGLTASQGDVYTVIQSECYIFIPGKSFNVTHLMTQMKNQISALRDPFPSLDDLKKKETGLVCETHG